MQWVDYELIDSGNLKKLERFGKYTFIRPDSQAIWKPKNNHWVADGVFDDAWKFNKPIEKRWVMKYNDVSFWVEPTPFRHFGVFPEQADQWDWMVNLHPKKVLNLFGYTGIASLILAKNGAEITHVDASKKSVAWARENQVLSHLENKPIRWIVDDALKFVKREVNRNSFYDGIILDPPKFGRGPGGEVWKIEESLPPLLNECKKLLNATPLFVVITTYASTLSAISLGNLTQEIFGGTVTSGELMTKESGRDIPLPSAIFARCKL